MSDPRRYFAIPGGYGEALGLRWAPGGEAIEHLATPPSIGLTFALADEVALFLSGFHVTHEPAPFAYILHLMKLLGVGREFGPGTCARLSHPFLATKRPLRNAGVLCGYLCLGVRGLPDPPPVEELNDFPRRPWFPPRHRADAEEPPLGPDQFEALVREAVDRYAVEDLLFMMQFGRGPADEAAEQIADEAEDRPRDLSEVLDGLVERPRLAASGRLISRLDGALTFPARERPPSALPTGGYADVSTRGQFEAILPGQLALDPLEFLRRYASHELLYYHREEPAAADDEELVLVVDQGVRTWGDVRVVLSAAALALARRAARRGVLLRIATTADAPEFAWSPESGPIDAEALGSLMEGSDFSRSPASALRRMLEGPATAGSRDVVLLTHPRTLAGPEAIEAARGLASGMRLFVVTADEAGEVVLSELRGGGAVAISRCRTRVEEPPPKGSERTRGSPLQDAPWTGDVEPIPFPFDLRVVHPLTPGLFAFDREGRRLLAVAGPLPMIHAWDVARGTSEILPRPFRDGAVLPEVSAVVGVAGGFVLGIRRSKMLYAAHYDLVARRVTVHPLGPPPSTYRGDPEAPAEWLYRADLHSLVVRFEVGQGARGIGLDLGVPRETALHRDSEAAPLSSIRARKAAVEAWSVPGRDLRILTENDTLPPGDDAVYLDRHSGEVRTWLGGVARVALPTSDGRPALRGRAAIWARVAGGTLALLHTSDRRNDPGSEFLLFEIETGRVQGIYPAYPGAPHFALSADGRRFARQADGYRLTVHEDGAALPALSTARGSGQSIDGVRMTDAALHLRVGDLDHRLRWAGGRLATKLGLWSGRRTDAERGHGFPGRARGGDDARFVASCESRGLRVMLDAVGQVAILDRTGRLLAMFAARGESLAGWSPCGERFGPPDLIGGPPTPRALEVLGEALRAAQAAGALGQTLRGVVEGGS